MTEVKSPYNFVPAPTEEEVYKPEWATRVSHDIPFSDGESGEIELKITAETPVFVRNGHSKGKGDSEFSHYFDRDGKKKYFIPATSVKGMLRNVLEILSFSRMKQINDHRHSIRQIVRTQGTLIDEGYTLVGNEKKKIRAGYLTEKDGDYFIFDCGQPYKIRYTELDSELKTDFANQFGGKVYSNMNSDFSAKTGKYKYETVIGKRELEHSFEIHPLEGEKEKSWVSTFQHLKYVRFSKGSEAETFYGRIVCVGQASTYDGKTSRRGEYVFKGKRAEVIKDESVKRLVLDEVMDTFFFINRHNQGDSEELTDWKYWKTRLAYGIPVFYRLDEASGNVKDLGLTFMYKQPVRYSTVEMQGLDEGGEPDLAETIFGQIGRGALKGRVMVSNFELASQEVVLPERSLLLASPKSSFTPFYVKQRGAKGYSTYNSGGRLSGFKRYPVHRVVKEQDTTELSREMLSHSRALGAGSTFTGKIRFHNLRRMEIGALLSSVTLHNSQNTYHSLGGMKPFGYGRVRIEVLSMRGLEFEQPEYLRSFEFEIKSHIPSWEKTVKELLVIGTTQDAAVEDMLEYMPLENFQKIKNDSRFLRPYSEMVGKVPLGRFYWNNQDMERAREEYRQIRDTLEQEAKNALRGNDFDRTIELYREIKMRDAEFDLEAVIAKVEKSREKYFEEIKEESRFQELLASRNISEIEQFIRDYPLSNQLNELRSIMAAMKALQGVPERLRIVTDFDMFAKEAQRWVEKVKKTSDLDPYVTEVVGLIKNIIQNDLNIPRAARNWNVSSVEKGNWSRVTKLVGRDNSVYLYDSLIKNGD